MFCQGKTTVSALKSNILLICVDEAHVFLPSQWGHQGMREEMHVAPSYLRAQVQATTKAPTLAMTASAKVRGKTRREKNEIDLIKEMCSVEHSPTTTISISPVLHNHLYVTVKKPPSTSGFYGRNCYSLTDQKVGYMHVLWRLYLKSFVSDLKSGQKPKRAIIYVKKLEDLGPIDDFLSTQLSHLDFVRDHKNFPWVINSSSTG